VDRAPADHRENERSKVARLVGSLQILPFDSACTRIAARINAELLNRGTPISITDVFIAATGLRHRWAVVTNNTKNFRRIDGLTLEEWR
jgi:tRNA(fMet)-specific endonuclease VapC